MVTDERGPDQSDAMTINLTARCVDMSQLDISRLFPRCQVLVLGQRTAVERGCCSVRPRRGGGGTAGGRGSSLPVTPDTQFSSSLQVDPAGWAKGLSHVAEHPPEWANAEISHRSRVVGMFPNGAAAIPLITAVCFEQHRERIVEEARSLFEQFMAQLASATTDIGLGVGPPTLMAAASQ